MQKKCKTPKSAWLSREREAVAAFIQTRSLEKVVESLVSLTTGSIICKDRFQIRSHAQVLSVRSSTPFRGTQFNTYLVMFVKLYSPVPLIYTLSSLFHRFLLVHFYVFHLCWFIIHDSWPSKLETQCPALLFPQCSFHGLRLSRSSYPAPNLLFSA